MLPRVSVLWLSAPRTVAAFGVGLAGFVTSGITGLVAAAGDPNSIVPWAQVGGSVAAVGGLSYVAKLMADGRLVARDPARVESTLVDLARGYEAQLADSKAREDWLKRLLEDRVK